MWKAVYSGIAAAALLSSALLLSAPGFAADDQVDEIQASINKLEARVDELEAGPRPPPHVTMEKLDRTMKTLRSVSPEELARLRVTLPAMSHPHDMR